MDDLLTLIVYFIAVLLLVVLSDWIVGKLLPDKPYTLRGVENADITHVIKAGEWNRLKKISRGGR